MSKNENITAEVISIHDFFTRGIFEIPHYQRAYSWTTDEVKNLIEDIFESFQRDTNAQYLLGAITTIGEENTNTYEILDGQQRITTLSLIFKWLSKEFTFNKDQFRTETACDDIIFKSNGDEDNDKSNNRNPRIIHGRESDRTIYDFIIKNIGQQKSHKLIDTYDLLNNYNAELTEIEFIRYLLHKVMFVHVNTHSLESAYQIFETLNDRTKSLQKIDLIRNRLFREMQKDQVETACKVWDTLYSKISLIINGRTIDTHIQSLFNTFIEAKRGLWIETKDLFIEIKKMLSENGNNKDYPYNLFSKIANSFGIYMDVHHPGGSVGSLGSQLDNDLIRKVKSINNFKISFAILFALFDLCSRSNNKIPKEVNAIISNLVNFIKRTKYIGNLPVAKYGKEFNVIAKDIINLNNIDELNSISFYDRLTKIDEDNKKIINSNNFIEKLKNTDFKEEIAKDILIHIHNHERDTEGEHLTKTKDLHAEHICPQELKYDWKKIFTQEDHNYYLGKLGNFTLLSGPKNIEASNEPFAKKKYIYKESRFPITSSLSKEDKWDKDKIQQRTEELAKKITYILELHN